MTLPCSASACSKGFKIHTTADLTCISFCASESLGKINSCVNNFVFKGQMEAKFSDANTLIFIFGWCDNFLVGISYLHPTVNNQCGGPLP